MYQRDLSLLKAAEAAEAFERLWRRTIETTMRQILRQGVPKEDAKDVASDVYFRLWKRRKRIRAQTPGEWSALVYRTTQRAIVDRAKAAPAWTPLEEIDDLRDDDVPFLDALAIAIDEGHQIYEAADRLWLGEVEDDEDAEMGAAALKLILVDGYDFGDAADVLGFSPEDLERWQADPAVVARALFSGLCWSNDALAGYVLCPDDPLTPRELDRLSEGALEAGRPLAWNAQESRILLWRVRNGLFDEQIFRALGDAGDPKQVTAILQKLCEAYPFRDIAKNLLQWLDARGRSAALSNPDFWKRVAFEYHTRCELPHKQIVERAGPPSEEARFSLSPSTLNSWFGNGRLWARLAVYFKEKRACS